MICEWVDVNNNLIKVDRKHKLRISKWKWIRYKGFIEDKMY
jgi:hypothetical protein